MASVINFSSEINRVLQIYGTFVNGEVKDFAKEGTEDAANALQNAGNFKDRTGDYRKGWEVIETKNGWITRNKTDYQLTHLLEKGHAKRNGGRTKKYVHIKPIERTAIENFEAKIRSRL